MYTTVCTNMYTFTPPPWYGPQYPPLMVSTSTRRSPPLWFGFGFWWFCGSETIIIVRYFDDLARRRDLTGSGQRRDHRKPNKINENHYICNDIETISPVVEISPAPAGVETIENQNKSTKTIICVMILRRFGRSSRSRRLWPALAGVETIENQKTTTKTIIFVMILRRFGRSSRSRRLRPATSRRRVNIETIPWGGGYWVLKLTIPWGGVLRYSRIYIYIYIYTLIYIRIYTTTKKR